MRYRPAMRLRPVHLVVALGLAASPACGPRSGSAPGTGGPRQSPTSAMREVLAEAGVPDSDGGTAEAAPSGGADAAAPTDGEP
jgi:hypothetical protein